MSALALQGLDQPRRRDLNREAREQAGIVSYIRTVAPDLLVFHPANGGWRTPAETVGDSRSPAW
jgi:hypothetical protein